MTKSKSNHAEQQEHSATDTAACILKLTEAERRARDVVDSARRRKTMHVKKARDESAVELEHYRVECDAALAKCQRDSAITQSVHSAQFERDLDGRRDELAKAFKLQSASVLAHLLRAITDVDIQLHHNFRID